MTKLHSLKLIALLLLTLSPLSVLAQYQWRGAWISDGHDQNYQPAPYFRKAFTIFKPIRKATATIAAAGLYQLSINGKRVGDHVLDPAFTRYDRRCLYVDFDVTSLVAEGKNAVGVVLGNGWYNHQAHAVWDFDRAPWRNRPAFCLDLTLEYADGTKGYVSTDLSWKTSTGAWVYNNIYTGDHYDFRLEKQGWNTADFDDHDWQGIRLRPAPAQKITRQRCRPIRIINTVAAKAFRKLNDSTYVYDFGYNMAGITRVKLQADAGTVVHVAHAERLHQDGSLDASNIDVYYRGDKVKEPFQTDVLYLDGKTDVFTPEFSYKGFRYVQLTASHAITATEQSVTALEIHSDVDTVGSISSPNEMLNKIFAATNQAYISNLMGYPTDCPQREKNGWTGDSHLAIETGLYSFDGRSVYVKWLQDIADEQQQNGVIPDIVPTCGWGYGTDNGLDWTSCCAIIPWQLYLFYGDSKPLQRMYPNIKRYVDYVDQMSPDHLSAWGRGDWVPVKSHSNKELTSSVYFYVDALILSKAARLMKRNAEARHYAELAGQIRDAINAKFLDREKAVYASGTQTEMSVPLAWGVCPDELRQRVADNLAANVRQQGFHLDVGVLGCKAILNALSKNGHAYEAYRLAIQDSYPSWGWWIKNGATTLHENWDINATRDCSDNHIMFGEIGAWLYKGLGGIFPDEEKPGFKNIILQPNFIKELGSFTARHKTRYGEIVSSWRFKGKKVIYDIDIPEGCTATVSPYGKDAQQLQAGHHQLIYK